MPPVVFTDGNQDACRLARREDDDHLIGRGSPEETGDEVVAPPSGRRLDDRHGPVLRLGGDPVVVLAGDILQNGFADRVLLPVPGEEPDHVFGLLKRLNQAVQQHPIEAAVAEPDTILMMLGEGIHGLLPASATRQDKPMNAPTSRVYNSASRAWDQGAG